MSILRQLERRGADPTLPWGSSYIPTNGQLGFVTAGVPMNDDTALSIVTVASCVNVLADSVSTLDLNVMKDTNDRTQVKITPAPNVVSNPWPEGTLQDFLMQVMVSLTLRGNFFGKIVQRDADGYADMIQPLHPDWVMARRATQGANAGKRIYTVQGQPCPTEDMVHIPALLVPGSFIGLNPVEYMRSSWGLAAAAERYGGQFFANSANPSGILSVEEDLNEDETLAMARQWKQLHGGLGGAQYPAVLTGGAKWTQVSISPDDAQFLQTRTYQKADILSWFRVPPHMVGAMERTSSWGAGIEQMEIGYVVNTLLPWLNRIESALNKLLRPGQVARFDLSSRLRGDTLQRYNGYTLGRNGSWLMIDEIRRMEGLPDLPNGQGQIVWAPLNFAPVDKILAGDVTGVTPITAGEVGPGAGGVSSGQGGPGGGIVADPSAPGPGQDTEPS